MLAAWDGLYMSGVAVWLPCSLFIGSKLKHVSSL
jgi:hypothetical protein